MFTDIGIDLGTYKTTIMAGKKTALEERSVVAVDNNTGKPILFGEAAYSIAGRTQDNISIIRPIEHGVISDTELALAMLRAFLRKSFGNRIVKPRVVITVPGGTTDVQQRAAAAVAEAAGGRNVSVIETATAAAIGLGLNFSMPHGSMIIDIGAGTTDIAVISLGGIAECVSLPLGSLDYDREITRYVRDEHGVNIGPHTAENIKKQIGTATARTMDIAMTVGGIDIISGMPKSLSISSQEIYDATLHITEEIGTALVKTLENTLPDLAADIAEDGIHLVGGGAKMYGFAKYFSKITGVPVVLSDIPTRCVSKGAGIAVRNPGLLRNADFTYRTRQDLISDET